MSTSNTFDLTRFPFEIQYMIAKESLIQLAPITVGHLPQAESSRSQPTGDTTRTCTAFHTDDLIDYFYTENVFEIVSTQWYNFFEHKFHPSISHIQVRTWSIFERWETDMLWLVEQLQSLPSLRTIGLRVNGSPGSLWSIKNLPIQAKTLKKFIEIVCRACKGIELVYISIDDAHAEALLPEWTDWIKSSVPSKVLSGRAPPGRKDMKFRAFATVSSLPWSLEASDDEEELGSSP